MKNFLFLALLFLSSCGFTQTIISPNGQSNPPQTAGTAPTPPQKVGVNTTTPEVTLHINGVDAVRVPAGITAERPLVPKVGDLRFNTQTKRFEGFNGLLWVNL